MWYVGGIVSGFFLWQVLGWGGCGGVVVGLIIRIRGFSFFWEFPGGGSGWWEGGYWYVVGDGSSVCGAAGGGSGGDWGRGGEGIYKGVYVCV